MVRMIYKIIHKKYFFPKKNDWYGKAVQRQKWIRVRDAAGMEVRGSDSPAQDAAVDGGGETRPGGDALWPGAGCGRNHSFLGFWPKYLSER